MSFLEARHVGIHNSVLNDVQGDIYNVHVQQLERGV
jgi:hypothetical protein